MEVQLKLPEELREAFSVRRELRSLDEQEYLRLLESMTELGYRLFALRDSGVIVSLAGLLFLLISTTGTTFGSTIW